MAAMSGVVMQEGPPSLAGRCPPFDHLLGDARLRDLKPELEHFAVNAWRAPKHGPSCPVPTAAGDSFLSGTPAHVARANPIIMSPIAAIQPPTARIAIPRHAAAGPASGRLNVSVRAMVSVIAA
jgi:hypothetical protein